VLPPQAASKVIKRNKRNPFKNFEFILLGPDKLLTKIRKRSLIATNIRRVSHFVAYGFVYRYFIDILSHQYFTPDNLDLSI